ncbi:HD domain-containing protein, partial [bacterium]|nr:HD domain-containing protein [bacterium]
DIDIETFQNYFKDIYEIWTACNKEECLSKLQNNNELPDVILLDIYWGKTNPLGIEILKEIRKIRKLDTIPVIIYTRNGKGSDALDIIKEGGRAQDWIEKDVEKDKIAHRINMSIESKRLKENLERKEKELITERIARKDFFEIIKAFAKAIDSKDSYTHGHSTRVADWAKEIARKFGLPAQEIEAIETVGLLHDVGKIGVSEEILHKPDNLTDEEWKVMSKHPGDGEHILKPITYTKEWLHLVRNHHEKFNGTGYPDKLKGKGIPIGARILAVADAYDAMTSDRPYRKAFSTEEAKKG